MPNKTLKVGTSKRKKISADKAERTLAASALYVVTRSGKSREISVSTGHKANHAMVEHAMRRLDAKLSDPEVSASVKGSSGVTTDRSTALKFLKELGMATPGGKLSRRFGG